MPKFLVVKSFYHSELLAQPPAVLVFFNQINFFLVKIELSFLRLSTSVLSAYLPNHGFLCYKHVSSVVVFCFRG